MKTIQNKTFNTKGADGRPNGRIIRVWERGQVSLGYGPGQVYVTTLLQGCSKGPHLHMRRDSYFCCIRGSVRITRRTPAKTERDEVLGTVSYEYKTITSGLGVPGEQPIGVYIPAGTPCQLYNPGHEEALVINVSSEPYDPTDEHEVEDWNPNAS